MFNSNVSLVCLTADSFPECLMKFESNGQNEIFFVDGAEHSLTQSHFDAFSSASAHFLEAFSIDNEVDVYISQRSVLHAIGNSAGVRAWHMPPSFDRDNSIVCVYVDPNSTIKEMITSLAHEIIHAWQVDRGDFVGSLWKGTDLTHLPYRVQPWEIEAHGHQSEIAQSFFDGKLPAKSRLKEIISDTDKVFQEILNDAKLAQSKKSFMKIAKVAGAIGLGALIGM